MTSTGYIANPFTDMGVQETNIKTRTKSFQRVTIANPTIRA